MSRCCPHLEKEQQEAIEHIDEVQNEIDRYVWVQLDISHLLIYLF